MNFKKVYITGGSGFLGRHLIKEALNRKLEVIGFSRNPLFFNEPSLKYLNKIKWEKINNLSKILQEETENEVALVNCVALASVSECEKYPEMAHTTNALLPLEYAELCKKHQIHFFHISTDGLFNNKNGPKYHSVNEKPDPVSMYGKTKFLAEEMLKKLDFGICMRLSFIAESLNTQKGLLFYLAHAIKNKNKTIKGYSDVWFNPVSVSFIAQFLFDEKHKKPFNYSLLHLGSSEAVSKFHFLKNLKEKLNLPIEVIPENASLIEGLNIPLDQSLLSSRTQKIDELLFISEKELQNELNGIFNK